LARQIDFRMRMDNYSMYPVRTTLLACYTCPADHETGVYWVQDTVGKTTKRTGLLIEAATNSYAACYGALGNMAIQPDLGNGVFSRGSKVRVVDIRDGSSMTLALGERGAFFTQTPWAGVASGGTAITTPGAPVYGSYVEYWPTMTMARI